MCEKLEYGILTVSGKDNVGIGASASCFLLEHKANILEEHGKVFVPEYAIETFYFAAKPQKKADIRASYKSALEGLNPVIIDATKPPKDGYEPFIYVFEIVAVDKPGIAARIERSIAALGINIRQVEGRRKKLGGSHEAIYTGSFWVKVPPESLQPVRDLVDKFVREDHWDIDLRPEKSWYGTNNLVPLFLETMTSINSVDPPSRR